MIGATLARQQQAEAYADLYEVPIEEVLCRYGAVLLTPVPAIQEAEGLSAEAADGR